MSINKNKQTNYSRSKALSSSELNKINRLVSRQPKNISKGLNKQLNQRISFIDNKGNNRHCQQDEACNHCCQCWLKFKDEYNKRIKYLQVKLLQQSKQNRLLKEVIQRLTRQSIQLRLRVKNSTDIQLIRQRIRQQLKSQIDEQIRIRDIIQKQKIVNLSQTIRQSKQIILKNEKQLLDIKYQLEQQNKRYRQKQNQCQQIKKELNKQLNKKQQLIQINKQLNENIIKLNHQLDILYHALKQKDYNITQMKSTIDYTDNIISKKSSQLAQKDFQKHKITLQSNYKSQILQKLQKTTQQHTKSISLLQIQKSKLNQLVNSLNKQLIQTDRHKHILKVALDDAQIIALQKSVSLQNLKYDVNMLKYTLV